MPRVKKTMLAMELEPANLEKMVMEAMQDNGLSATPLLLFGGTLQAYLCLAVGPVAEVLSNLATELDSQLSKPNGEPSANPE